jgi:hypothetical protein
MIPETLDRFVLENKLWVIASPTGIPIYDFDFRQYFDCRTPYLPKSEMPGVARVGAFSNYESLFQEMLRDGIRLLNTPEEQERCSSLPHWYPLCTKDTPRSRWYSGIPTFEEITREFALPVFVKGARQTSRHQAAASIVRDRADYERVTALYRADEVLHWQQFVCREFVRLRKVEGEAGNKVAPAFEFRTFWHRGTLLGAGRYWYAVPDYTWTELEKAEALAVATRIATALDCGFLVIDLAMTEEGRWIVIECNDGMESGYAGVSPFALWPALLNRLSPGRAMTD